MSLKMSQLIKLTNVSKSTILYYIKEGLLPEPKKPKPNLHLYDESVVSTIEFIKFLQQNLHYSISEIKTIIDDNKLDFDNGSSDIINYLTALNGVQKSKTILEIRERAKELGLDTKLFDEYEREAKKLAKIEYDFFAKLLESNEQNSDNRLHKLIFDTLLTLKPYIFNQATINEHKERVKKSLGGEK